MKSQIKAMIALLLLLALTIGTFGCTKPKDPSTGSTSENTLPAESATNEAEAPLPEGERLLYYEDFEDEEVSENTEDVLSSLGWIRDSAANGAYSNNTTKYSLVEKDGSKRLFLNNNISGGGDSYVFILTAAQMGKYHEKNYTYQYDIVYESSADNERYIALVSDYNGKFYNSFHLRHNGKANNQCHSDGSWYTYDASGDYYASATDSSSIPNKLLGVNYASGTPILNGMSVSIRYVVDWENGNSVYLRLNEEGFSTSGEWILVSKADSRGNGTSYFNPEAGGAALVLKTGGKMDGYIDNITVWEGTGDEPKNKTSPLLTSKTEGCSGHNFKGSGTCLDPNGCIYCGTLSESNKGHVFESVGSSDDQKCKECGSFKSAIDKGWHLIGLPAYEGGRYSKTLYFSGHGIDSNKFPTSDNDMMNLVSQTNETEFKAYCTLLEKYGANKVYSYSCDGNIYAQYKYGDNFIYTYYTASVKEARIIIDKHSEEAPTDFGYTYEKKPGDTTTIYQYGVPMNEAGLNISKNDEKKIDCGMVYVIKLADNSVFVLDGGGYQQFDQAQIDGFMKFLRNITGTKDGEKVKISGWYMSHGHQDHMAGFLLFVKKYHENLDFDRIFFNFPSPNSPTSILAGGKSTYSKLITYINKYIKDDGVKYMKLHTGQIFSLADIKINVIYTHEDIVSAQTGMSEVAGDYNNSSSVIKITVDGKEFLFLGDVNKPAMEVFMQNNSAETLKCDIIQLAHHVINDLSKLYNVTKSPVVLVPQSPNGTTLNSTRKKAIEAAKKYAENDMLFYASEGTVGLEVKDGKVTKVFEAPVDGDKYTGWSW